MKARITYTADGAITSLAIGDGLVDNEENAGEGRSAEIDLPNDFQVSLVRMRKQRSRRLLPGSS